MRGTTIGRRVYNPNNFLTNPTSKHAPTFLSSSPFSTSSGRGRGRGVGDGGSPSSAAAPGNDDSEESQPSGLGHGRGKPIGTRPVLPAFASFIAAVKKDQPGSGRGRVTTESGPSRPTEARPEPPSPKKAESHLPSSIISTLSGTGRGKPVNQGRPTEPMKEENRHIRSPTQPQTRSQITPGSSVPKMSKQDAVKKAVDLLSRRGGEAKAAGGEGRGRFVSGGMGGGRGRGRTMVRRRGRGRGRRDYDDDEVYGKIWDHPDAEEQLAQSVGVENMQKIVEGFEEACGRVLPCPVEEDYVEAFDTNCSFEFEPEYLMGEFDKNPDIDEKPPMPLRDVLEKVKPFMMAYIGVKSHEEWEELVEDTMKQAPLMKEIVDSYSGPDRVSAKKQQEELERVAKTIPATAPDSVKSFADRAVLSLQVSIYVGHVPDIMLRATLAGDTPRNVNSWISWHGRLLGTTNKILGFCISEH
ncbi:unnamed protein product [Dovyalis caffra]|uniref:Uncharacterized protein n=1 Tax=Dovyalis caffra TaxID=77055 RepID=A0AAV1RP12_9ROSI|nr:unnamed protein product [Dovyalis caffra]